MKLKEIRESYEELSGIASKLSRQLAFAGIGMIWIQSIHRGADICTRRAALAIYFTYFVAGDRPFPVPYTVGDMVYILYPPKKERHKRGR
jgi:hypothetical protein